MLAKNYFIVFGLILSLLVFGCSGQTGPAQKEAVKAPETPSSERPGEKGVEEDTVGVQTPSATPEPAPIPSAVDGLVGKSFEQLAALGVPVECDVKINAKGEKLNYKMYLKGKDFRMELDIKLPTCSKSISIARGDTVYTGCEPGKLLPQCDWLKIEADKTASSAASASSSGVSGNQLKELPSIDFDCKPALFGDEKFATPGKVCDLSDLAGAAGGSGDGMPSLPEEG